MARSNVKIRRGGRRRNKAVKSLLNSDLNIYHCNLRGLDFKRASLQSIISSLNPNVVTLNETQYHGNKKIQLVGYESYCRNRTNKGGGGIATAVNEAEAVYALKVHEGVGDDEIVITRHEK